MPPKKKAAPRAPTAKQQAAARARAEKQAERQARAAEARAARNARRAEIQESIHDVDQEDQDLDDDEVDQQEPRVEIAAALARALMTDDLLAVMAQLQQQQPQRPPTPQPPVRGPAAVVTDCLKLLFPTFTGEGDPMLAEKWLEQIEKCLDTLGTDDDATRIKLATFQVRDSAEA